MLLGEHGFRDLVGALEQGIGLLDQEGVIVYANPALAGWAGSEEPALEGQPFEHAFPALKGEIDWAHAARNAIERGRTLRLARHLIEGGVQVDCTLGPVRLGREQRCCALLTVEDVTDAVRGETSMLRQARTQAITNFGDSVAHEIRNPLNSLHMNVQLLREWLESDATDRERLDHAAATVQREIKRLDRVVRDFVQYSRPPAPRLERGSINHVVRAALDLLDGQIRDKKLVVDADLRSAKPVLIDRDRLQRAIYNVLLNAVQVLPEGGGIVCRSRDEERRCLLEIADNGPGIDPGKAAHVFDVFYTTKEGGTGLGLALANRIVEEHGGRMAVVTEPGRGATFAMFLPYEGPPPAPAEGPTTVQRMPESGETR